MHKTPKMIEAAGYKNCFKHGNVLGPEGVFGFSTQNEDARDFYGFL